MPSPEQQHRIKAMREMVGQQARTKQGEARIVEILALLGVDPIYQADGKLDREQVTLAATRKIAESGSMWLTSHRSPFFIAKFLARSSLLARTSELMKKRITITKKKNIAKDGPDDPAFTQWKKNNTTLKDMGAETINSNEYEDEPENSIEVPVIRVSNGGANINKTKFYSEAVAPELPNTSTNPN